MSHFIDNQPGVLGNLKSWLNFGQNSVIG
jgi:hypothetical protein